MLVEGDEHLGVGRGGPPAIKVWRGRGQPQRELTVIEMSPLVLRIERVT